MRHWLTGTLALIALTAAALAKPDFEIRPTDHTMGNPKAKVTLIEYAAFTCPYCAATNEQVIPLVKKNYIDTGKVFYVFRLYVRAPEDGFSEKMASCAPRARYFAMADAIFKGQPKWNFEYGIKDGRAQLVKIGQQLGLNEDQINKCMNGTTDDARLNAQSQEAVTRYGLSGTPTFVINGQGLESGGMPYEDLAKKLDQAAH